MRTKIKLVVIVLLLSLGIYFKLAPLMINAQSQERTAEQVYKNIQVFKGQPAANVYDSMNYITAALGVNCAHCHVPNQFEKDEKSAKQTARRMIQMTQTINQGNFGDNQKITCFTCHRGKSEPVSVPSLFEPTAGAEKSTDIQSSKPLPTTDQVFDRYLLAVGGKTAIEKVKTRVMKGEETGLSGLFPAQTRPIEIYTKLPDKIYKIYPSKEQNAIQVFDGTTGWQRFGTRTLRLGSTDLGMLKREALLLNISDLREQFTKLNVTGQEMLNRHQTIVIEAIPVETKIGSMPILREKLFFDAESGLLLRRYWEMKTSLGVVPVAADFEDYREVDQTKFPFTLRISLPVISFTRHFKEITFNQTIGDDKFSPPEPK